MNDLAAHVKAGVSITAHRSPVASFLRPGRPRVGLNGTWTAGRWGEAVVLPVIPGQHMATGHARGWLARRVGSAAGTVIVAEGEVVAVRYLAPFLGVGRGHIVVDAATPTTSQPVRHAPATAAVLESRNSVAAGH
jgi:hypothetical protein